MSSKNFIFFTLTILNHITIHNSSFSKKLQIVYLQNKSLPQGHTRNHFLYNIKDHYENIIPTMISEIGSKKAINFSIQSDEWHNEIQDQSQSNTPIISLSDNDPIEDYLKSKK